MPGSPSSARVSTSLTSPSKWVTSDASAVRDRSRAQIAAASSASADVHVLARAISTSTWASPPMPLCIPSRSHAASGAGGSVTDTGIQGPTSS